VAAIPIVLLWWRLSFACGPAGERRVFELLKYSSATAPWSVVLSFSSTAMGRGSPSSEGKDLRKAVAGSLSPLDIRLERRPIPAAKVRGCLIAALKEVEESRIPVRRSPHLFVLQNELA
jgi:hypothetical protein